MPNHKRTGRSLSLSTRHSDIIADALTTYAERLLSDYKAGVAVPEEEARALDRALRSCPSVGDVGGILSKWCRCCNPNWNTTAEIRLSMKKGYYYP